MGISGDESPFSGRSSATTRQVGSRIFNLYAWQAAIIGEVTAAAPGKVRLKTAIGGLRAIEMLAGEQLPRIC